MDFMRGWWRLLLWHQPEPLHLVPPREPWSPLFHVSQDESDSVCILLLFCSSFIPNPAVFAMFVSHPWHRLCRNDQGWEKRASFCSGNKCLILFHQNTWTKNKDYKGISRWLLKYLLFFFFWARKKREMFRHFILILIPYLVSYPVETMILPHIYKMSLLIIQSLGSASADLTNIRWKIVGKTILESSRRQSLDLRGFGHDWPTELNVISHHLIIPVSLQTGLSNSQGWGSPLFPRHSPALASFLFSASPKNCWHAQFPLPYFLFCFSSPMLTKNSELMTGKFS